MSYYDSVDLFFFFFKQKTAYEMRISDWSSDVCSSDLLQRLLATVVPLHRRRASRSVRKGRQTGAEQRVHRRRSDRRLSAFQLRAARSRPLLSRWFRRRRKMVRTIFLEIGRASCRVRVCQYVWNPGVAVILKKKKIE